VKAVILAWMLVRGLQAWAQAPIGTQPSAVAGPIADNISPISMNSLHTLPLFMLTLALEGYFSAAGRDVLADNEDSMQGTDRIFLKVDHSLS